MRDPRRIDGMLLKLGKIWKKYPQLRLGQLLENYIFTDINQMFNQEDSETGEILNGMLRKKTQK